MSTDNNSGVETSKVANFFSVTGWWYASAALMLVAGIGLIAILILPNDDTNAGTQPIPNTPSAPLSSPATQPEPGPSTTGWDDLGCNGTRGDTGVPQLPPKVTWVPIGPWSVPSSATYGPTKVDGFVRTCYQHTPTGAVLAATNVLAVAVTVPQAERADVLVRLMTAGAVRDEAIATVLPPDNGGRWEAFDVEGCSPERCNVVLISSLGSTYGENKVSMIWTDGDWYLDGTQRLSASVIDAVPPGYAAWKA